MEARGDVAVVANQSIREDDATVDARRARRVRALVGGDQSSRRVESAEAPELVGVEGGIGAVRHRHEGVDVGVERLGELAQELVRGAREQPGAGAVEAERRVQFRQLSSCLWLLLCCALLCERASSEQVAEEGVAGDLAMLWPSLRRR